MNFCAVLPCLNPDDKFLEVVANLIDCGFKRIVIIDDGSDEITRHYFETVKNYPQCDVISHYKNLGKGRAVKTAINHILVNYSEFDGLVTVNADNQYDIDDIYSCVVLSSQNTDSLILGSRNFKNENISAKSRFGNKMTHIVLSMFCNIQISDTLTGLRAMTLNVASEFLDTKGERFEYETNMLLDCKNKGIEFKECRMKTNYIDQNKTYRFNILRDSFSIYTNILKFILSSFTSTMVDVLAFTIIVAFLDFLPIAQRIAYAAFIARAISSVMNFTINKKLVFHAEGRKISSIIKYIILSVVQIVASYGGTLGLSLLGMNQTLAKVIVDALLFFPSFTLQNKWVFKK